MRDNGIVEWPKDWPRYKQACFANWQDACDLLVGPCNCGAWHQVNEFRYDASSGKLYRNGEQVPYQHEQDLEPGPIAIERNYKSTKISKAENTQSQLKISKGVAEKQYVFYTDRLGLLIRTLRRASIWQRLHYLFTSKIPETSGQRAAKGSGLTLETYDEWMRH